MKEKKQFETCITVTFCNLTLKQGYNIGKDLEAFLKQEKLGYYYGSSRQRMGSRLCFKFFLHVPTRLYPKALSSLFAKLKDPVFHTGAKVETQHSWFIRQERNTELYSRIVSLVHAHDTPHPVAIQHPEMVAITLSTLPEDQYAIHEGDARIFASSIRKGQVLVCIR